MAKDKYSAVWVSHSSINDWLTCPRAYYLKNVYKDPKTGHKLALVSPPLTLGGAVHQVMESLSKLVVDRRFEKSLLDKFEEVWKKVSGKRGGFTDIETEARYKERGKEMLKRVEKHPGPLKKLAVKIKMDLPYYWLSEKDNIILCGMIDWLEYLEKQDSVHIIDFKTGKMKERKESLQLPIYYLVVSNTQERKVEKLSYWYVDRADEPEEQKIVDMKKAEAKILKIAKEIKLARQINRFKCEHGGCRACTPMEKILKGEGEFIGEDEYGKDLYLIEKRDGDKQGEIL